MQSGRGQRDELRRQVGIIDAKGKGIVQSVKMNALRSEWQPGQDGKQTGLDHWTSRARYGARTGRAAWQ